MTDRELAEKIKTASTDMEKNALWGKLLFGGMMALPVAQALLQKKMMESFVKGQTYNQNMMMPGWLAMHAPQGALGIPNPYRSRYGLENLNA